MFTTLSAPAAASSSFPGALESRIPAALVSSIAVLFFFGVPVLAAWAGYKLMLLALRRYRQRWVDICLSIVTIAVNGSCAAVGLHLIPIGPRQSALPSPPRVAANWIRCREFCEEHTVDGCVLCRLRHADCDHRP
ncbi:hypothetical protein FA95DRAFT_1558966 [Auriscalpium vulgare]|uniref:Uncharacterized protein n=1 Tax=Auriscalpium vulgare TaxID=40419 RepID=A0ACB8RUZ4_9AGAM|nr:hypothetical protein FA95DRAFT_1558966 [Auriscalpium vulgare]